MMELCLGTALFGMNYGIFLQKKHDLEDAVRCLDYAAQNGVNAIDTAKAYGTAEEVVGEFLKKKSTPRDRLFISTKFKPNLLDDVKPADYERVIEQELTSQLKTLNTDYVDAYLFHSSRYAFDEDKLSAIHKMVEKGYTRKVGVSIYEPEEAFACLKSPFVDFMQAPYSIFDHRMKLSGVLKAIENNSCDFHTRSAFIQGLIMMDEDQAPDFLSEAKPIIKRITKLCDDAGISRVQLALQYVKREKAISHLVFGVDSLEQLKDNIRLFEEELPVELLDQVGTEFDNLKADIVMPSLWKR